MSTTESPTGWAFPGNARKAHYFGPDRRALCGKWSNMGMSAEAHEPDTGPSSDDCAGCRRKLDASKPQSDYAATETMANWETFYSCGRCGSDVEFEPCGFCIGCGYSEDNPDPGCRHCKGEGVAGFCVSSVDWCLANPLNIERPGERHSVIEYQELDLRDEEESMRHV